ncbi:unnamed protein product [Closterium sp. NIES-64]|nr:unnamed protein product [Closterium sp. NIES-64]
MVSLELRESYYISAIPLRLPARLPRLRALTLGYLPSLRASLPAILAADPPPAAEAAAPPSGETAAVTEADGNSGGILERGTEEAYSGADRKEYAEGLCQGLESDCSSLSSLPDELSLMPNLRSLTLSSLPRLSSLPSSLHLLSHSIRDLSIISLKRLQAATAPPRKQQLLTSPPALPPTAAAAAGAEADLPSWCSFLRSQGCPAALEGLSAVTSLRALHINLWHNPHITHLPPSLFSLSSLATLTLSHLVNVSSIPETLSLLAPSLTHLHISHCPMLSSLPSSLCLLSSLECLHIEGCKSLVAVVKEIPGEEGTEEEEEQEEEVEEGNGGDEEEDERDERAKRNVWDKWDEEGDEVEEGSEGEEGDEEEEDEEEDEKEEDEEEGDEEEDERLPAAKKQRIDSYPDQLLLEPLDASTSCLAISRSDGSLSVGGEPSLAGTVAEPKSACLLLGFIELLAGTYVLLVTNRQLVGAFKGAHVFRATAFDIVPCCSKDSLTPKQKADEEEYLVRLRSAMSAHGLFFSYGADITTRCADAIIPRFASIQSAINKCPVEVTLIARRGVDRIGTRMWRRGADSKGAVANFVETEQVVTVDGGAVASYVQIRGSIPVLWEQIVNLTYKPKLQTVVTAEQPFEAPLRQHLRGLKEIYGPVIAVDLVNQDGGESRIGSAYAGAVNAIKDSDLRYVPFDFHHECGATKYHQLSVLDDQISKDMETQGFFLQGMDGTVQKQQHGTVRTNCVDCLDRTNVTQSWFARHVLEDELRQMGLLGKDERVAEHSDFDAKYKIMWADHGDDISTQYTGTPALKGDYVRYGKRSPEGFLQDGVSAVMRYFFNNYTDGVRQDGLDLVMGNYTVKQGAPSPFTRTGIERYTNLRVALVLLVASTYLFLRNVIPSSSSSLSPVIAATSDVYQLYHEMKTRFADRMWIDVMSKCDLPAAAGPLGSKGAVQAGRSKPRGINTSAPDSSASDSSASDSSASDSSASDSSASDSSASDSSASDSSASDSSASGSSASDSSAPDSSASGSSALDSSASDSSASTAALRQQRSCCKAAG